MKLRQLKHKTLARLDNPNWEYFMETGKVGRLRNLKPCRSYSPWCADCNNLLFFKTFGRFPYNIEEASEFDCKQYPEVEPN